MSQRFVRCSHCGTPHDAKAAVCPTTGKRMRTEAHRPADQERRPPLHAANTSPSTGFSSSVPSVIEPLHEEPPLIGQVLGNRYRILSVLGAGGMGVVYEAEHLGLERPVAVKVLNPLQAKKKNTVKRFQQEARAAGGIGHPNICEVYDMGWLEDGCPYLVMERLHGQNLADRIKKAGGMPFLEVVEVLCQVLAGLMAAHEKGIMHRDIKPENIFLARRTNAEPVAKILDFGVSKGMAGGPEEPLDLTRTGMVMGTPYYMSPEQARGERNLDARVDVYACGVMLYECLTGRRPFLAPNYNALLLQILTEAPRPARERRPDLPAAFDPILRRAMARARDDRYPTAAAMRRDLLQVGKQLQAEPPSRRDAPAEPPRPQAGQAQLVPYTQQPQSFRAGQTFPFGPQAPQAPQPPVGQYVQGPPQYAQPQQQAPQYAQPQQAPQYAQPQQAPQYAQPQQQAPQYAQPQQAPQYVQPQQQAPQYVQPQQAPQYVQPQQQAPQYAQPQQPPQPQYAAPKPPPAPKPPAAAQPPLTAPLAQPPRPSVRPAAGMPARPAPLGAQTALEEPRRQTMRMAPPPQPPSSEEKLRAPVAGASPRQPTAAELDTGPTNEKEPPSRGAPRPQGWSPSPAAAPAVAQPPRPAPRSAAHDYSDGPTYVISREEILGDFVPSSRPVEVTDWDAETTITTAPPEWDLDTSDDARLPDEPRFESLRERIEHDYGDIPVDDATLVRPLRPRPPRRK